MQHTPPPARKPSSNGHDFYCRALLIEDNKGDARLVELYLEEADSINCEIVHRTSLREGMEAMEAGRFDAILLDLSLPDSRGFETLERFILEYPDANVLVLTGLQDKKLGIEAVKAGAQDYLAKGNFDSDWLAKALRYSIERNRITNRLEEAQRIAKVGHWEYYPATQEISASSQIYRMTGCPLDCPNFSWENIQRPDNPLHFIAEIVGETMVMGRYNADYVIQRVDDGEETSIYADASVVKNSRGDIVSVNGILQDITFRKVQEQLEKDRDLAMESAKIKDRLLARVSHEMRTPMNAILGMSNLALKTDMDEEQEGLLKMIHHNSEHLLGIINDILEISTLQNGKLRLEHKAFDLWGLLSNLENVVKHKTTENFVQFGLEIMPDVPRFVGGDPNRLHQVLINLVGNAFKFTPAGRVTVAAQLTGETDGQCLIRFSVEDTGIGIPEDKIKSIFKPFNRIESKEQNFEGTGLGLSIAENIVTMQGGYMDATSVEGEGATFFFEMPFGKVARDSGEGMGEDARPQVEINRPIKLLLAEDNKFNQIVAKKTIEKEYPNISVIVAENGKEAVELLTEHADFDLVLMDLQMPVMDGYEATSFIRKNLAGNYGNLPILAMTAEAQIAKDDKFRKFMMDDCVLKPFKPEQLFEKLACYTQPSALSKWECRNGKCKLINPLDESACKT